MYPLSTLIIVFIASCYSYANAFPFMDTNPYLTNLQPNKIHSTTLLENLISFSESGENEYYPTGIEIANFLKTDIDHISYTEGRSLSKAESFYLFKKLTYEFPRSLPNSINILVNTILPDLVLTQSSEENVKIVNIYGNVTKISEMPSAFYHSERWSYDQNLIPKFVSLLRLHEILITSLDECFVYKKNKLSFTPSVACLKHKSDDNSDSLALKYNISSNKISERKIASIEYKIKYVNIEPLEIKTESAPSSYFFGDIYSDVSSEELKSVSMYKTSVIINGRTFIVKYWNVENKSFDEILLGIAKLNDIELMENSNIILPYAAVVCNGCDNSYLLFYECPSCERPIYLSEYDTKSYYKSIKKRNDFNEIVSLLKSAYDNDYFIELYSKNNLQSLHHSTDEYYLLPHPDLMKYSHEVPSCYPGVAEFTFDRGFTGCITRYYIDYTEINGKCPEFLDMELRELKSSFEEYLSSSMSAYSLQSTSSGEYNMIKKSIFGEISVSEFISYPFESTSSLTKHIAEIHPTCVSRRSSVFAGMNRQPPFIEIRVPVFDIKYGMNLRKRVEYLLNEYGLLLKTMFIYDENRVVELMVLINKRLYDGLLNNPKEHNKYLDLHDKYGLSIDSRMLWRIIDYRYPYVNHEFERKFNDLSVFY